MEATVPHTATDNRGLAMFKSIIRRWREWRTDSTVTMADMHGLQAGDYIRWENGVMQVVTTTTGNTLTARPLRWYERLWKKVEDAWNWRERRAFNKLYDESAKRQKQRDIERDILNAEVIGE